MVTKGLMYTNDSFVLCFQITETKNELVAAKRNVNLLKDKFEEWHQETLELKTR